MKSRILFLMVAIVVFWAVTIRAQGEERKGASAPLPLVTDRPDFTESSATVPEGHVQFEFGLQFDHDEASDGLSIFPSLLRYGLSEGMELRLGLPAIQMRWSQAGDDETSPGTMDLGFKFVHELADWAQAGFLPFVAFPLKGADYRSRGVDAGVKLVWALSPTDWLGVSGNVGLIFSGIGSEGAQDQLYEASLSLGFGLTDDWGVFVETYTIVEDSRPEDAAAVIDGGVTWRVSERVQLDAYLGVDLNASEAIMAGMGSAVLW